jgi:TatD DNase family protein
MQSHPLLTDIHCHLSFPDFDADRDAVIERLRLEHVSLLIEGSTDAASSRRSIALAQAHEFIYANVGLHPHEVHGPLDDAVFAELETLARSPKVVGIGEIGLDYHYPDYNRQSQLDAFREMLRMAKRLDLPAVIHCRDAWEDTLRVIAGERSSNLRGVMHCFSGDLEIARQSLREGFLISIPGTVTYKNSKLPEVVGALDLRNLLSETDAPYLSPVPLRGKRNEPAHVRHVVAAIARIRNDSIENVAETIAHSARNLFCLP